MTEHIEYKTFLQVLRESDEIRRRSNDNHAQLKAILDKGVVKKSEVLEFSRDPTTKEIINIRIPRTDKSKAVDRPKTDIPPPVKSKESIPQKKKTAPTKKKPVAPTTSKPVAGPPKKVTKKKTKTTVERPKTTHQSLAPPEIKTDPPSVRDLVSSIGRRGADTTAAISSLMARLGSEK